MGGGRDGGRRGCQNERLKKRIEAAYRRRRARGQTILRSKNHGENDLGCVCVASNGPMRNQKVAKVAIS